MEERTARLLEGLQELQEQAAALTARLTAGTDAEHRYNGKDSGGLVRVTVDGQGRTTDVWVHADWRRMTAAADLPQAVVAAVVAASHRRLEGWATAMAAAPDRSAPEDAEDPLVSPNVEPVAALDGVAPSGVSGANLVRALLPLMEAAERQLDEVRHRSDDRFASETSLTSPDGAVTVRAQGGVVAAVRFEASWIARAGAGEIAQRLCRLFQAAYDQVWDSKGSELSDELATLTALTANPARMLRQLGLS